MKPPFLRSGFNYDTNKAGDEDAIHCTDPTRTKQSFAEEVDINTIVKRFNLTGQLPDNVHAPTYADFDNVYDFHTAMNAVATARESFDAMPAGIRARFHNDPQEFVVFCSQEENRDEAIKMGLLPPKALAKDEPTAPPKAPETPPSPPKGEKGDTPKGVT